MQVEVGGAAAHAGLSQRQFSYRQVDQQDMEDDMDVAALPLPMGDDIPFDMEDFMDVAALPLNEENNREETARLHLANIQLRPVDEETPPFAPPGPAALGMPPVTPPAPRPISPVEQAPEPLADDGDAHVGADSLSPLARRVKASIAKVKAERKLLTTNKDILQGFKCAVTYDLDTFIEENVSEHSCGKMSHQCPYCGARFWALESTQLGEYTACCKRGKIKLPPLAAPTPTVKRLLLAQDPVSKAMRSRLRTINTNVSFSSIQMNDNHQLPGRPSVPFFRMQGTSIHRIGALTPAQGVPPSFMQCFFLENSTNGITDRTGRLQDPAGISVLRAVHDEVRQYNPFILTMKANLEHFPSDAPDYHVVFSDTPPAHALGPRTYNAPTAMEVGGIVMGEPGVSDPRKVTIVSRANPPPHHLKSVRSKHSTYDPLSYTLLHMQGCQGWRIGMHTHTLMGNAWADNAAKMVTVLDYYRYLLRH